MRAGLTACLLAGSAGLAVIHPNEARADTSTCPGFAILGSRGSGQDIADTNGFAKEVGSFVSDFESMVPAGVRVFEWANPYPAVKVAGIDGLPNAASAALGWGAYQNSVTDGQGKLRNEINAIRTDPVCGSATKIILAGYSQGAQVTGNVYQTLTDTERSSILGVLLLGDPLFNPASQRVRGDFDPQRVGSLAHPKNTRLRPEFPTPGDGKVLSYCHADDAICQGFVSFRRLAVSGVEAHGNYDTVGDAASPETYPHRAAAYFALKAGFPTPAPAPVATITPIPDAVVGEAINISAAASTDPSGQPLTYAWDLGTGTFASPSASPTARGVTFNTAGTYTIRVQTANTSGRAATASATVNVLPSGVAGTALAPTALTTTPSADGTTDTLSWQPPTSGPAAQGYEVFTDDGCPLADIMGGGPGSVSVPAAGLPSAVDVESLDDAGEGGYATATNPVIPDTIATVDGPPVSVTFAQATARLNVSFFATAGQPIYVNGTVTSGYFTQETLLDPVGNQITTGSQGGNTSPQILINPVVVATTGVYTLDIVPPADDSGTITVQVFGSYLTASPKLDGTAVSVTIPQTAPGKRAQFTFTATAGQPIYVNGTVTSGYFTTLTLLDPSGNQIGTGSRGGQTSPQQLLDPVTVPTTGTYTLNLVPPAGDSGTITLRVFGSYATASPTLDGKPISVTIPSATSGQQGLLTFTTTSANQPLYATAAWALTGCDTASPMSFTLYDSTGTQLAYGNAACMGATGKGDGQQFSPLILTTPGTYTIRVATPPETYGTLSMQVFAGGGAVPIPADGTMAQLQTSTAGQSVLTTFTSTAANQPVYATSTLALNGCQNGSAGASFYLYDATTKYLTSSAMTCDIHGAGGGLQFTPLTVPNAGTYTVLVIPYGGTEYGTITMQVFAGTGTGTSTPLPNDGTVTAVKTTTAGQSALLTFTTISPNQAVYGTAALGLTGCSSAAIPGMSFYLFDTAATWIANGGVPCMGDGIGGDSLFNPVVLANPGTYTILMIPNGGTAYGTASVQIFAGGGTIPSLPTDGTVTPVKTTAPGQSALASFTTTAPNQAVYATVNTVADNCATSAVPGVSFFVYDSNAQRVSNGVGICFGAGTGTGMAFTPIVLPKAGTYTILAVPQSGLISGTFNMQVYVGQAGTVIASGSSQTNYTIGSPGQSKLATLTTSAADQTLSANAALLLRDCRLSPSWAVDFKLFGPDATQVASGSVSCLTTVDGIDQGAGSAFSSVNLPQAGTYTMIVYPEGGTATGVINLASTF